PVTPGKRRELVAADDGPDDGAADDDPLLEPQAVSVTSTAAPIVPSTTPRRRHVLARPTAGLWIRMCSSLIRCAVRRSARAAPLDLRDRRRTRPRCRPRRR